MTRGEKTRRYKKITTGQDRTGQDKTRTEKDKNYKTPLKERLC